MTTVAETVKIFAGVKYGYAGVLPYATVPLSVAMSGVVFLLGREHPEEGWSGSNTWADFGGAPDDKELPDAAGAREMWEETMGMLGTQSEILSRLRTSARPVTFGASVGVTWLLPIAYDAELPKRFSNVVEYLSHCTRAHPSKKGFKFLPSCPDGWLEKTGLMWISARRLKAAALGRWSSAWSSKPHFRPELLGSVRAALKQQPNIFPAD